MERFEKSLKGSLFLVATGATMGVCFTLAWSVIFSLVA